MTPSTPQLNTSATPEPVTAKTSQAQSSPTTTPTGTSKPYSQQQTIRRLRCRGWQLRPDLRPGTRCLDRDQLGLRSTRTSLRVGRLAEPSCFDATLSRVRTSEQSAHEDGRTPVEARRTAPPSDRPRTEHDTCSPCSAKSPVPQRRVPFEVLSAHAKTVPDRRANACAALRRRAQPCNT